MDELEKEFSKLEYLFWKAIPELNTYAKCTEPEEEFKDLDASFDLDRSCQVLNISVIQDVVNSLTSKRKLPTQFLWRFIGV